MLKSIYKYYFPFAIFGMIGFLILLVPIATGFFQLLLSKMLIASPVPEQKAIVKQNEKKDDIAVFETFPARNFPAIEYPVRHEVEASSHQCVINNFHVRSLLTFFHSRIILGCLFSGG